MNDVMEKTLAGHYAPLPSSVSPEINSIVTALLSNDPENRPTSAVLLQKPICKLFTSGLLEIVQSQPSFDAELRKIVVEQVQQVKQSISMGPKLLRLTDTDGDVSTASVVSTLLEGAVPIDMSNGTILQGGIVKKQSSDGTWKRRYLCIRGELDKSNSSQLNRFDLVLAVSKESIAKQSIVTPFEELEDVFPVPSKYTGANVPYVFAVAFKTGKRLSFQARNDEEREVWMDKIQELLGI
jgi:protein kinase